MTDRSRTDAPQASPCVMSDETKEALGVAIAFFDNAIRKKNEAMAECQRLGQEIYVRNLFSQRNSLERHQLLIQQVVTSHPQSAAIAAEPRTVTDEDRQYASELLADIANTGEHLSRLEKAALWFRKARVESALADEIADEFLRNLIDWTHLYAFSGESWLSHKTASVLIACARKKKVTQADADALKACPSIYPYAESMGIDLIALARNDRQTGEPRS